MPHPHPISAASEALPPLPPSPPSEAGCSLVQPAPAQAPAVPASKTKKRPYTSVEVQDFALSGNSRPFNRAEMELIESTIDHDKLFDAKGKFNHKLPGGPAPVSVKKDPSRFRRLTKCATLAIEDYNSQTSSNYRFVNIEMVTGQPVHGMLYHITFQARNAEKECRTFQATVFFNINMIEVMNISMKGSNTWYFGELSELI